MNLKEGLKLVGLAAVLVLLTLAPGRVGEVAAFSSSSVPVVNVSSGDTVTLRCPGVPQEKYGKVLSICPEQYSIRAPSTATELVVIIEGVTGPSALLAKVGSSLQFTPEEQAAGWWVVFEESGTYSWTGTSTPPFTPGQIYIGFLNGATSEQTYTITFQVDGQREPVPEGNAPEILSINFPEEIPADGTEYTGYLNFRDRNSDVILAEFQVLQALEAESYSVFNPQVRGTSEGLFAFTFSASTAQRIRYRVTLMDGAGNRSQPEDFTFAAVSLRCPNAHAASEIHILGEHSFLVSAPERAQAGESVCFYAGWAAKTKEQVQDFLNAIEMVVKIDGTEIVNAGRYWRSDLEQIERPEYGTLWVGWWSYVSKPLRAGGHEVYSKWTITQEIFDGFDTVEAGTVWEFTTPFAVV